MVRKSKIEKLRHFLHDEIVACVNCRPWVEDETVWSNPHTYLDDLLFDSNLKDDEWGFILENLFCPNCGHPLESRYDQIEIKSEYDHKVETILKRIESEKIVSQLYEFNRFLSTYPYLGLCSPSKTGRLIFDSVKNGKAHFIESDKWFRARKLNNESRIFLPEEMGPPDPEKVYIKEGRYNHTGQSFLYLSNFEKTAFLEIKEGSENICSMQKFTISNLNKLLDLRANYENIDPKVDLIYWAIIYNGFIENRSSATSSWKPEYFVPRNIADAARYFDYNGIIYTSAVSEGENLVLFKYQINQVFPVETTYSYKYDEGKDGILHLI